MGTASEGTVSIVNVTFSQEGVDQMLGLFRSFEKLFGSNAQYFDVMSGVAVQKAKVRFDFDAIAIAQTNMNLWHMFDYRLDQDGLSDSPDFHKPLWNSFMAQSGQPGSHFVDFSYKTAKVVTPFPSAHETDIDQDILDGLKRQHVFNQKARVMEEGLRVSYGVREARRLFVPDFEGGFTRPKRYTFFPQNPGQDNTGAFTDFWNGWWYSDGNEMIQKYFKKQVEDDLEMEYQKRKRAGRKEVYDAGEMNLHIESIAADIERGMTRRARSREMGSVQT